MENSPFMYNVDTRTEQLHRQTLMLLQRIKTPQQEPRSMDFTDSRDDADELIKSVSKLSLGKRPPPSPSYIGTPLSAKLHGAQYDSKRFDNTASPARIPRPPKTTAILFPPKCLEHRTADTHQEHWMRLETLCGSKGILRTSHELLATKNTPTWMPAEDVKPASIADILRVHDWSYVKNIEDKCAKLKTEAAQKTNGEELPMGLLDSDTRLSPESYAAARMAAGAVIHAIDTVVANRDGIKSVFVAVRPPGHHAGPRGAVAHEGFMCSPDMCSSGFCLLNNVAIGAAYARNMYGRGNMNFHGENKENAETSSARKSGEKKCGQLPEIKKVAIIDFDIHHGNGTEAIVRNLVPHQEQMPLPASWAPVSFTSYKPWLNERDAENVFFGSVHLYSNRFYPCSGPSTNTSVGAKQEPSDAPAPPVPPGSDGGCGGSEAPDAAYAFPHIVNVTLDPVGQAAPGNLPQRARQENSRAKRLALMKQASDDFRSRLTTQLLPALDAFAPDLVLVSSGFDGHADDFYHYLSEEDYAWFTRELVAVAEKHGGGRVVSVLEGGYNVKNREEAQAELKAKNKAPKKGRTKRAPSTKAEGGSNGKGTSRRSGGGGDELLVVGGADVLMVQGEPVDGDVEAKEAAAGGQQAGAEKDIQYGSLARCCAAHVMALSGPPPL
jgi:acetoin utilization deacetylase AcuC-like enzyme